MYASPSKTAPLTTYPYTLFTHFSQGNGLGFQQTQFKSKHIFIYNSLMGRGKIDGKFIEKYSKRWQTFKKRKDCVIKKARELSTLCGVRLCVIIDSPDEPQHEVWPSEMETIQLTSTFNNTQNKEKSEKSTSPEEMLRQQAIEAQEQISKLKQKNHKEEMAILMHEYMTGRRGTSEIGSEEAKGLFWMAEERFRAVQARMDVLSSNAINVQDATTPIPGSVHDDS